MEDHDKLRSRVAGEMVVTLDGEPVELPAGRLSLNSIRCFLETSALKRQRVLSVLAVDGQPGNLALPLPEAAGFSRVDAESIALDELPLLVLTTAQQQVDCARESVETAVTLVLINRPAAARELWWSLACQLKEPILTLSLMPGKVCRLCGDVAFDQLRKWQLEQIAAIVREVDAACDSQDTVKISDALENRVLNWLRKLDEMIHLWFSAVSAGYQLGINYTAA